MSQDLLTKLETAAAALKWWEYQEGDEADFEVRRLRKTVESLSAQIAAGTRPSPVKRCNYPNCTKACGDVNGYCHHGITAQGAQGGEAK